MHEKWIFLFKHRLRSENMFGFLRHIRTLDLLQCDILCNLLNRNMVLHILGYIQDALMCVCV